MGDDAEAGAAAADRDRDRTAVEGVGGDHPSEWTRGYRQGVLDCWEKMRTQPSTAEEIVRGCARLVLENPKDAVMLSVYQRTYLP